MKTQKPAFRKNKLVSALGVAMLGGFLHGCSSDNSTAASQYALTLIGGAGSPGAGANGGDGGNVFIENDGGSGGTKVLKTGKADTNFSTPGGLNTTVDLGDTPWAITTNTTLDLFASVTNEGFGALAVGELYEGSDGVLRVSAAGGAANYGADATAAAGLTYVRNSDDNVYVSGAAGDPGTAYTGLSIAAETTLTIDIGECSTSIEFTNDIENAGTISLVNMGGCNLYVSADKYIATGSVVTAGDSAQPDASSFILNVMNGVSNDGAINASGFDNDAGAGGFGAEVTLAARGYVINKGAIDTSGGDGVGAGGDAGYASFYGLYVENSGGVDLSGGNNTDIGTTPGNGGDGGELVMSADHVVYNSGDVDGSGGDGDIGGDGYYGCCGDGAEISIDNTGEVKNSGNFNLNGGTGYAGDGGEGGNLNITVDGGDLRNTGDVSSRGGDTLSLTASGGDGGEFTAYLDDDSTYDTPQGDMTISGTIDLSGGSASQDAAATGDGGDGGYFNADNSSNDLDMNQLIQLLGYASIDTSGGAAGQFGGEGGNVDIETDYEENDQEQISAGPVTNNVAITARGGDATSAGTAFDGDGGMGGYVDVEAATSSSMEGTTTKSTVNNSGDIDTSGGAGVYYLGGGFGGEAGGIDIDSYTSTTNSGNLTANGGSGGNDGGNGGYIDVDSETGHATNSGDIMSVGGDGVEYGGYGESVDIAGKTANNTGDITVNGGNALNTGDIYTNTFGGEGGGIQIIGAGITAATNSGTLTSEGGSGIEAGDDGCIQVNITFSGDCN